MIQLSTQPGNAPNLLGRVTEQPVKMPPSSRTVLYPLRRQNLSNAHPRDLVIKQYGAMVHVRNAKCQGSLRRPRSYPSCRYIQCVHSNLCGVVSDTRTDMGIKQKCKQPICKQSWQKSSPVSHFCLPRPKKTAFFPSSTGKADARQNGFPLCLEVLLKARNPLYHAWLFHQRGVKLRWYS